MIRTCDKCRCTKFPEGTEYSAIFYCSWVERAYNHAGGVGNKDMKCVGCRHAVITRLEMLYALLYKLKITGKA